MNSQVADLVGDRDGGRASTPLTPLPIPLTKDHHCCKKTAHGRRSRFLHKLASGNDRGEKGNSIAKCDCPHRRGAGTKWRFRLPSTRFGGSLGLTVQRAASRPAPTVVGG